MKRLFIVACILMPLYFAACGDKKNSDNTVATVPPPTNCIDGSTYCNSNQYNGYNGFSAYPNNPYFYNTAYAWNSYYGTGGGYYGNFCNCPTGSRPVYNGQFGMGCVSVNAFQPYAHGAMYWGWGGGNSQWVNLQQISNTQGYPANNGCYQNIAQSCFVDQANSCGVGATCQATGGGSRIGICVTAGTQYPGSNPTVGGYR